MKKIKNNIDIFALTQMFWITYSVASACYVNKENICFDTREDCPHDIIHLYSPKKLLTITNKAKTNQPIVGHTAHYHDLERVATLLSLHYVNEGMNQFRYCNDITNINIVVTNRIAYDILCKLANKKTVLSQKSFTAKILRSLTTHFFSFLKQNATINIILEHEKVKLSTGNWDFWSAYSIAEYVKNDLTHKAIRKYQTNNSKANRLVIFGIPINIANSTYSLLASFIVNPLTYAITPLDYNCLVCKQSDQASHTSNQKSFLKIELESFLNKTIEKSKKQLNLVWNKTEKLNINNGIAITCPENNIFDDLIRNKEDGTPLFYEYDSSFVVDNESNETLNLIMQQFHSQNKDTSAMTETFANYDMYKSIITLFKDYIVENLFENNMVPKQLEKTEFNNTVSNDEISHIWQEQLHIGLPEKKDLIVSYLLRVLHHYQPFKSSISLTIFNICIELDLLTNTHKLTDRGLAYLNEMT